MLLTISQKRSVFPVHVECLFWLWLIVFISCFEYIHASCTCMCAFHYGCESFQLFRIFRPHLLLENVKRWLESEYHSVRMHFFHPCSSSRCMCNVHPSLLLVLVYLMHVSKHFSSVQFSSGHRSFPLFSATFAAIHLVCGISINAVEGLLSNSSIKFDTINRFQPGAFVDEVALSGPSDFIWVAFRCTD